MVEQRGRFEYSHKAAQVEQLIGCRIGKEGDQYQGNAILQVMMPCTFHESLDCDIKFCPMVGNFQIKGVGERKD